jgi:hypothetical protein
MFRAYDGGVASTEHSDAVAALIADLLEGITALRGLPLEDVPPALVVPGWP